MKRRLLPLGRLALIGLVAGLAIATAVLPAHSTVCTDICPGTGACTINAVYEVAAGSVLDCSGRDLTINQGKWLRVFDGHMTLKARNLTIQGGSSSAGGIEAKEEEGESVGGVTIELSGPSGHGNLVLSGAIRANGTNGGGSIDITASGDVTLYNVGTDGIESDGTGSSSSQSGSGGDIRVEAGGSITLLDPIHAEGASGGINSGGTINLVAGGNISTAEDGHLSAGGMDLGGGTVRLVAEGDIVLDEHVTCDGYSPNARGGHVEISTAGQLQLLQYIHARGSTNAGSGNAGGGQVHIETGCGGLSASAGGDIDVSGGTLAADQASGAVSVESLGPVSLASGTLFDVAGKGAGARAGSIRIESGGTLLIDGAILDAQGHSSGGAEGAGGVIELSGCKAEIKGTSVVDARGYFGGRIAVYGEGHPGASGTQPVTIRSGAGLRSTGTAAERDGVTELRAHALQRGSCSNDATIGCWVHADCTVGCQTGSCGAANPDSEGVAVQFDLAAARSEVVGAGAECSAACQ